MQLGGLLNSPWAMNLGTKTSCLLLSLAWGWKVVSDCEGLRSWCQDVTDKGWVEPLLSEESVALSSSKFCLYNTQQSCNLRDYPGSGFKILG